jgi:hypothetical protein
MLAVSKKFMLLVAVTLCNASLDMEKLVSSGKSVRLVIFNIDLFEDLESLSSTRKQVMLAGCGLIAILYGGSIKDRLNYLCYSMYMHLTATSTQLPHPERLPPTENAAKFHIFRVHLQVF